MFRGACQPVRCTESATYRDATHRVQQLATIDFVFPRILHLQTTLSGVNRLCDDLTTEIRETFETS